MGTKRRVCIWWKRRRGEYVVQPAGWKPKFGEIVLPYRQSMIDFASASKLVLKERQERRRWA